MTDRPKERIVAEITKNWGTGGSAQPISELFELVIEENAQRGYMLESWHLSTSVAQSFDAGGGSVMTETIIAVFKHRALRFWGVGGSE